MNTYVNLLLQSSSQQQMLEYADIISSEISIGTLSALEISNEMYIPDQAVEELGLELDLITQLVEDFVIQIVKSSITFVEFLGELQDLKKYTNNLDYTILRDLAHKNLGVARNLRIKDAEKLLEKIMTEDDLNYITKCVECLFARAVLLKPNQAYQTIRLIQIKETSFK